MLAADHLDLAAQYLAAEIFRRHLRGGLAAGAGDVGIEAGHIEDAAEFQGRFCLREDGAGRKRQRCGENAGKNPFH